MKTCNFTILGLSLGILLGFAPCVRADVVLGGTGLDFTPCNARPVGVGTRASYSFKCAAGGPWLLQTLKVALAAGAGCNSIAADISSDSGGVPGSLIVSTTITGMPINGCNEAVVTATFPPATLQGGGTYWVTLSSASGIFYWAGRQGSYVPAYLLYGIPAPRDLVAASFAWSTGQGGANFQYDVRNGPLATATTAKLFWTSGTTKANIIPGAPLIFTQTIPIGASGLSAVIPVPAANFANPPAAATHVLLVLDPDNLVQESDEGNNVIAIPILDLVAVSFGWNNTEGGLDFRYRVDGGALPAATSAKLFWASGTSRADTISDTPFFTQQIPAGFTGLSDTIRVTGSILKNAPGGVTHMLLVVDPDAAINEFRKQNNLKALHDANIVFSNPTRDAATVSPRTFYAIKDFLREAGQKSCTITRTVSTPEKQADIMFECSFNGTCAGYAAAGQAVLGVYSTQAAGLTRTQIRAQTDLPSWQASLCAE